MFEVQPSSGILQIPVLHDDWPRYTTRLDVKLELSRPLFSQRASLLLAGLVRGYGPAKIQVYNVNSGDRLRTLYPPDGEDFVSFIFSGQLLYAISRDATPESRPQTLRLLLVDTGECLSVIKPCISVDEIVLSPLARYIIVKHGATIHICDPMTGDIYWSCSQPDETRPFRRASEQLKPEWFSPDAAYLAFNSRERGFTICNAETGTCMHSFPALQAIAWTFSTDSRWIAVYWWPGTEVQVYCVQTGQKLRTLRGATLKQIADGYIYYREIYLRFSPSSKKLVLSDKRQFSLWDLGVQIVTLDSIGSIAEPSIEIEAITFSSDEDALLAMTTIGQVLIWSPEHIRSLTSHKKPMAETDLCAWSVLMRNPACRLTIRSDGSINIYDANSGEERVARLATRSDWDLGNCKLHNISPDDQNLVMYSSKGRDVSVYSIATGELVLNYQLGAFELYNLQISSMLLAISTKSNYELTIYSTKTGERLKVLKTGPNHLELEAIAPYSTLGVVRTVKRIVHGRAHKMHYTWKIWDMLEDTLVRKIYHASAGIRYSASAFVFSDDSSLLVWINVGSCVQIMRINTGELIASVATKPGPFDFPLLSPDSATADQSIGAQNLTMRKNLSNSQLVTISPDCSRIGTRLGEFDLDSICQYERGGEVFEKYRRVPFLQPGLHYRSQNGWLLWEDFKVLRIPALLRDRIYRVRGAHVVFENLGELGGKRGTLTFSLSGLERLFASTSVSAHVSF